MFFLHFYNYYFTLKILKISVELPIFLKSSQNRKHDRIMNYEKINKQNNNRLRKNIYNFVRKKAFSNHCISGSIY